MSRSVQQFKFVTKWTHVRYWSHGSERRRKYFWKQRSDKREPPTPPMSRPNPYSWLTTSAIHSYIKSISYRTENIFSAIKANRVTMFREMIMIWCENHGKHINSLRGQNVKLLVFKQLVHIFTTGLNTDNIHRTDNMRHPHTICDTSFYTRTCPPTPAL